MKNIIALFVLALLFIGCNEDMTNVFAPTGNAPKVASQCKASCVISDIQAWDEIVAPEDTAMMIGLIGDTLRTYVYRLNDGREGTVSKEDFDTLFAGSVLPHCNVTEAIGSCPNY